MKDLFTFCLSWSQQIERCKKQIQSVQIKSGPSNKPWIFHVRCYL